MMFDETVVFRIISQVMVTLLFADALWVAVGLIRKKNRWPWIALYWVLLTIKNAIDFATMFGR